MWQRVCYAINYFRIKCQLVGDTNIEIHQVQLNRSDINAMLPELEHEMKGVCLHLSPVAHCTHISYFIINSLEQSYFWEANSPSAGQEIPCPFWNM
jgi:hypothetical protein